MSFSKQVKNELNSIQIKGNCCKKSYLLGALMSSENTEGQISLRISDFDTAGKLVSLLKTLYKCTPSEKRIRRGCFEATELSFSQKKLEDFLLLVSSIKDKDLNEIFTCNNCRSAFLRGLFCSCGTVSDPRKGFSLELGIKDGTRAPFIQDVIATWGIDLPLISKRNNDIRLIYRKASSIEDFLAACGNNNSVFLFYDITVEKDVRNAENRATNCVARNIEKAVSASSLQISAIESLISSKVIDDLPSELRITAEIRIKNPDMTLSELSEIHEPPISKSGLNHRLSKLIEEAKKRKLI